MTPHSFVEQLRSFRFEHTFNPYADTCAIHDTIQAPRARTRLLRTLLEAAVRVQVDAIWIGRDLGYRGGRRTGLALTDDVHVAAHGARWGITVTRATKGEVVAERTAAVIWQMLGQIETPIFLWNVFPLHPHEPEDPFTNRSHNSKEAEAGEELLFELVYLLNPRRLIAVGNDAGRSAMRLASNGQEVVQVRHPSYGGQTEFQSQMRELYGLRNAHVG